MQEIVKRSENPEEKTDFENPIQSHPVDLCTNKPVSSITRNSGKLLRLGEVLFNLFTCCGRRFRLLQDLVLKGYQGAEQEELYKAEAVRILEALV